MNRLWKRMERLEAEKRLLQEKLDSTASSGQAASNKLGSGAMTSAAAAAATTVATSVPMVTSTSTSEHTPMSGVVSTGVTSIPLLGPLSSAMTGGGNNSDQAANLTEHIINLRREVSRLKASLEKVERDHKENMAKLVREEKLIKEENVRLQRRLQMEVDRREALCRHLSESESSLEMDDERHFNESTRVRTISSPIPSYVIQSSAAAAAAAAGTATMPNMITSQMLTSTCGNQATSTSLMPNACVFVQG